MTETSTDTSPSPTVSPLQRPLSDFLMYCLLCALDREEVELDMKISHKGSVYSATFKIDSIKPPAEWAQLTVKQ